MFAERKSGSIKNHSWTIKLVVHFSSSCRMTFELFSLILKYRLRQRIFLNLIKSWFLNGKSSFENNFSSLRSSCFPDAHKLISRSFDLFGKFFKPLLLFMIFRQFFDAFELFIRQLFRVATWILNFHIFLRLEDENSRRFVEKLLSFVWFCLHANGIVWGKRQLPLIP